MDRPEPSVQEPNEVALHILRVGICGTEFCRSQSFLRRLAQSFLFFGPLSLGDDRPSKSEECCTSYQEHISLETRLVPRGKTLRVLRLVHCRTDSPGEFNCFHARHSVLQVSQNGPPVASCSPIVLQANRLTVAPDAVGDNEFRGPPALLVPRTQNERPNTLD